MVNAAVAVVIVISVLLLILFVVVVLSCSRCPVSPPLSPPPIYVA